jgi:MarR family transcriptional regulator, lower aerobic nicotinate degradation pathway regulator
MALEHRLPLALRAAYLAMHRQTDACLQRHGTTADQFVLLGLLADQEEVTQQGLVRRASSDPNTIRAMLVLLEKRGLVTRRGHPTDRRARSVTLTAKGRRIQERLMAETEPLRQRMLAAFRPEEVEALVGLLARLTEALPGAATGPRLRGASGRSKGRSQWTLERQSSRR